MPELVDIAPESVERIASLVLARLPKSVPTLPTLLSSKQVMELLGYSETEPFLAAARDARCPMIRINARKILFDAADVRTWLQDLKSALPEPRLTISVKPPRRRERRIA